MVRFLLCALFFYVIFSPLHADCPSVKRVKKQFLDAGDNVPVSEACLCSLLVRKSVTGNEAIKLITAFSRHYTITDTLLFCAHQHRHLRENKKLFTTISSTWKQQHPSFNRVLQNFRQAGATARMDSLFALFDHQNLLNVHQLLQWIDVKKVLDDYGSIPKLFYRVINQRPSLSSLALNQFEHIISDVDEVHADSLLSRFVAYTFTNKKVNTGSLFLWVLDQYGLKKLYKRQIDQLIRWEQNRDHRITLLGKITLQRFERQLYSPAIDAALLLHRSSTDSTMQYTAASVLYKSFYSQKKYDSAYVWLERTGFHSEMDRIEAIGLYQLLGKVDKAAAQLTSLPKSLSRDTLYLRQLLFQDSLASALRFVHDSQTVLSRTKSSAAIWKIRTTLYSGKLEQCGALLDSIKISSNQQYAKEMLDYRYWLYRLATSPEALDKFAQIEYTMFKGDRKRAAKLLCESQSDTLQSWRLGVRIARQLIDMSKTAEAVAVLQCVPAKHEAEYLYCLAEALSLGGARQEARLLLERLIVEFPVSMYTTQGRLLLSQIK